MKMWSCFNLKKINSLITETKEDRLGWTFWQTEEDDTHNKLFGDIVACEDNQIFFSIRIGDIEKLSSSKMTYFHCPDKDYVFKREKYSLEEGLLKVSFPNEMKIKDHRLVERLFYKYQDYKGISFSTFKGEEEVNFNYVINDLSTNGLSFVAPKKEIEFLDVGAHIHVSHITDQELEKFIDAEVTYLAPYDEDFSKSVSELGKLLKVGVLFKEGLAEVCFKTVANIMEKKQTKMVGLETDGFNGLTDDEIKRKISYISVADPSLAASISNYVEDIDRLRYLTPQMKQVFWQEVNTDHLAKALRISSKELIFDLLSELSDSLRSEFLEELNGQFPASAIEKSQKSIVEFIHEKEKEGVLVLSPQSFVKYV